MILLIYVIEGNIDLFLVLSNTDGVLRFFKDIYNNPKYKDFLYDEIVLYYLNICGKKVSSSHNLILKKK
ncbi:MAG: hypothetical protein PHG03_00475 [Bacilli bacterium]|nr:hypothetical protein [Bacilli bacterium]MDD4795020.1 hypothetical protein [Bacilli bacterium]